MPRGRPRKNQAPKSPLTPPVSDGRFADEDEVTRYARDARDGRIEDTNSSVDESIGACLTGVVRALELVPAAQRSRVVRAAMVALNFGPYDDEDRPGTHAPTSHSIADGVNGRRAQA